MSPEAGRNHVAADEFLPCFKVFLVSFRLGRVDPAMEDAAPRRRSARIMSRPSGGTS